MNKYLCLRAINIHSAIQRLGNDITTRKKGQYLLSNAKTKYIMQYRFKKLRECHCNEHVLSGSYSPTA